MFCLYTDKAAHNCVARVATKREAIKVQQMAKASFGLSLTMINTGYAPVPRVKRDSRRNGRAVIVKNGWV